MGNQINHQRVTSTRKATQQLGVCMALVAGANGVVHIASVLVRGSNRNRHEKDRRIAVRKPNDQRLGISDGLTHGLLAVANIPS